MMTREEKVLANIRKAEAAGYVFKEQGVGVCDESVLGKYRAQGIDPKGWYTIYNKDQKVYVVYGKPMKKRAAKTDEGIVRADYESKTVKELQGLCRMNKIPYSKMNKAQMVDALVENLKRL